MDNTSLGDRMKLYEGFESERRFMPRLPVIARIDGRAFHSFTRGLERPFDSRLRELMFKCTRFLVEETNALIGHTQSDEISLIWHPAETNSEIFFGGKVLKMASQLAALASVAFNRMLPEILPDKDSEHPTFDARVWNVPDRQEAVNYLIWREQDSIRNSISMAARAVFSHNQLHKKTGDEMQEMMFQEKGINWNDYPVGCKRGLYVRRTTVVRKFDMDEIDNLPAKHEARRNPDLVVERSYIDTIDLPQLTKMENLIAVIFEGEKPLTKSA